jgi:hypothetical protein
LKTWEDLKATNDIWQIPFIREPMIEYAYQDNEFAGYYQTKGTTQPIRALFDKLSAKHKKMPQMSLKFRSNVKSQIEEKKIGKSKKRTEEEQLEGIV